MYVTEDTTRTHPEIVDQLYRAAIEHGASRVVVCDTVGHSTPNGVRKLIRHVKRLILETNPAVKLDWHGHRDRGLDVINAITAYEEGADRLHGAGIGIGERAGNCPMDTLLVNMKLLGYIENDLLSADSLLPMGGPRPAEALCVLREMLRVLSTYRLYTQSHLKFHLDADPALQRALADARWSRVDLWDALGQTALGTQQDAHEIWHEIEPSLRRLLYHHHYRTDADQIAAHTKAREFYGGWTQDRAAGREQQVVLVESLWHEASRLAIERPVELARLLPGVAVDLAQTFGSSPMYEPAEFTQAVVRRLRDDDELKVLLSGHPGLSEEIVKSVSLTIGGGW